MKEAGNPEGLLGRSSGHLAHFGLSSRNQQRPQLWAAGIVCLVNCIPSARNIVGAR